MWDFVHGWTLRVNIQVSDGNSFPDPVYISGSQEALLGCRPKTIRKFPLNCSQWHSRTAYSGINNSVRNENQLPIPAWSDSLVTPGYIPALYLVSSLKKRSLCLLSLQNLKGLYHTASVSSAFCQVKSRTQKSLCHSTIKASRLWTLSILSAPCNTVRPRIGRIFLADDALSHCAKTETPLFLHFIVKSSMVTAVLSC